MRSLVLLLGFIVPLLACAQEAPSKYQEGKHYIAIDEPVRTTDPTRIEVTEVFWYGCSHCFMFEPKLKEWLKTQSDDVKFVATPAMWNRNMEVHARAFYTAKALGVLDKVHEPLFRALNIEKKRLLNADEVGELFAAHGVDRETFDKTFESFGVNSQVKQAVARTRGYQITGTPEMVVNGQYRVSARNAGGHDEMLKVVDYLIDKLRAQRS
ncbi:thiol:disulfide interchange protein DsbA/DsbL [Exilibacterium tricleocarpae]|uniref:Thiol:disulfide interchange protein n=1 Tax=Exilibacterium tricleocarpae TaxID=2591008 RepID=A0A545T0I7_9GAMM|nr:thiol:disulfide interchange protein DsbA/DsbL [Exilibacterium tricleocarpae]TQV70737.1 thiol:disulfide interchange protein DsbA/DsbL [Exilibacterium tricleocarpae]